MIVMKKKILAFIDNGSYSWMDIVDWLEAVHNIERSKAHKLLDKLKKKGIIIFHRRNLPTNTRI